MKDTMIGVDLAKNVIVLHGTSMMSELKFRKKLSRSQFIHFMQRQPAAVVVLEACGSAHYQAHEFKAYDAADAEAIAIAARQPEMRFVESRTPDQQARAVLLRARIVRQGTDLVNALRAVLYEFGQTVPQDIAHIKRLAAIVSDIIGDDAKEFNISGEARFQGALR
ncbi:IS110 family transposase [Agrobacterium tumefaciens]|uniref:IS110 family transposase n=2 Tax=Rhizobium/Agrobacterium group TaxID=227290 RepID=UPI0003F2151A|nr:IS110 family transposase [Agrobacterium tumefaciens]AHK04995.1 mobile element protein [Agrobacterium tumefaciens LBA4213 (Ach5)]AKC10728.1 transposase [Agrobacterium tumefaciens]AYM20111.1 hypothetical protein At15955_51260 [Agrobacterium tumefaciens]AYM71414.1 hypothetical protein AtA6_51980 [Agrobacterium tumefaciens]NIB58435.1 IS110 family transposase [Agrobacterium tumefaciens]